MGSLSARDNSRIENEDTLIQQMPLAFRWFLSLQLRLVLDSSESCYQRTKCLLKTWYDRPTQQDAFEGCFYINLGHMLPCKPELLIWGIISWKQYECKSTDRYIADQSIEGRLVGATALCIAQQHTWLFHSQLQDVVHQVISQSTNRKQHSRQDIVILNHPSEDYCSLPPLSCSLVVML